MLPLFFFRLRLALALSAVGTALLLGSAGCTSTNSDELTAGVVSGERPVAMEGVETFFSGAVSAQVTVGRGIGRGLKKGARSSGERYDYAESAGRTFIGSPLPPVTLHLILTNPGPAPVTVVLVDFVSDLGNFALDPDTLTIAPGQSAEPTAMVSELGVSADDIPFKVTLKVGGKKESKTIHAKVIAQPAAK